MKNYKSLIKNIFVFMLFTLGTISCNFLENKTLHIPKAVVQGKINKKFPITKNLLLAKITLSNPKVSFKKEKMYVESNYSSSLLSGNNNGKIYFSTEVRYDKEKDAVYLVNLAIEKITDKNGNKTADSKFVNTLTSLILNYVELNPVYSFKEDEDENDDKKIKIKNLYIKNGKLYVQT